MISFYGEKNKKVVCCMFYFIILEDNVEFNKSVYKLLNSYQIQNKLDYKISCFYDYTDELETVINDNRYYKIYIFDIELPKTSGIHIATKIREFDLQSLIILLTAHKDEHKEQMIENKIMYLKCISKQDSWRDKMIEILDSLNVQSKYNHILRIDTKDGAHRFEIDKIMYIKYEDRHSVFYMTYNITHTIPRSLKEIKDMLDFRFMYCHKSCIVNIDFIVDTSKKKKEIVTKDGTIITDVSLAYLKEIIKRI